MRIVSTIVEANELKGSRDLSVVLPRPPRATFVKCAWIYKVIKHINSDSKPG